QHRFGGAHRIVAFLAPPWADMLSGEAGLDLGRTKPPIGIIVDVFERVYPHNPILYVTEVHERLLPGPLTGAGIERGQVGFVPEIRFAADSLQEEEGFEPSVPPRENPFECKRFMTAIGFAT